MYKLQKLLNRPLGLWIVICSIITVNVTLYNRSENSPFSDSQSRKDASGFSMEKGKHFLYFYYYTNHFPLATLNESLKYSEADAITEIKTNGESLIMEYEHWSRLGEHARIIAFLPNAYLDGNPSRPRIKLFNTLIFISGLICLAFGFYRSKKMLAGVLLIILINSTPFFLYEIYTNQNIFGLLASCFFIILGLNVSLFFRPKISILKLLLLVIISGAIIGFLSEVRNEISLVIVSVILLYFLLPNQKIVVRIGLIVAVSLTFYVAKLGIRNHFENQFDQTKTLVETKGGHVYNGNKIAGHKIWHPIFCGLGDFDEKNNYKWDDRIAYAYATPILNEEHNLDIAYSGKFYTDNFYDEDSLYYVKFDEIIEYEEIVKNKVLSDISDDPGWYIAIIFKRIVRVLTVTLPFAYAGWLLLPLIFYLIRSKKWLYLKLLIVSFPLSITPVIIYSGKGSTYNSVFVYILFLVLILMLLDWLKHQHSCKVEKTLHEQFENSED